MGFGGVGLCVCGSWGCYFVQDGSKPILPFPASRFDLVFFLPCLVRYARD